MANSLTNFFNKIGKKEIYEEINKKILQENKVIYVNNPPINVKDEEELKDNEDQRVALQREILEELGVTISSLRFFGEGFYKNDELSINLIAYQCTPSSYDFTLIDHDTFAFVEPKDLVDFKIAPADMFIAESLWEYQTE